MLIKYNMSISDLTSSKSSFSLFKIQNAKRFSIHESQHIANNQIPASEKIQMIEKFLVKIYKRLDGRRIIAH
jgi:hypothetical protein